MARPGVEITLIDNAPVPAAVIDSGAAYMVGLASRGRGMRLVRSLREFEAEYGPRNVTTNAKLYDGINAFFAEGGKRAYVSRVHASDAAASSLDLDDDSANPTITVTSRGVGVYGDAFTVAVDTTSDGSVLTISDGSGTLEVSPRLPKASLLSWTSEYVTLADADAAAGEPATAAATNLATGSDGVAVIGDSDWSAALARFTKPLGIGQVLAPGETGATRHSQLLAHAQANHRLAILDASDATAAASLKASAAALAADANRRYGMMFGPHLTLPPVAGAYATRRVAPSGTMAGIYSRIPAGMAGAGFENRSLYAVEVVADLTDAEREDLNTAGMNVIRNMRGTVVPYGIRSLTNRYTDELYQFGPTVALVNEIRAKGEDIAENYVFAVIDGKKALFSGFQNALTGMLLDYYTRSLLYGETPAEAFTVDTGPAVNTPESIASGCIKALLQLRASPYGELVQVEIVRAAITDDLSQPASSTVAA